MLIHNKCHTHEWRRLNVIENIDIDFLESIRYKDANDDYELHDQKRVTATKLLKDMEINGMYEPFIISYGFAKHTMRLETGNHRIMLLKNAGYTKIPAIAVSYTHLTLPTKA